MEIKDILHTLAPGECITVEKLAKGTGLPIEEVERRLKVMVKADPDLEMIVNTQGTFVQVKRGKLSIENPAPTKKSAEEKKKLAYCYITVSGIAFIIGGFGIAPAGGFSAANGVLGLVIAFFVLLFFFECWKD